MGRYGASEALRNKKLQRKAVNYGINKLTPLIQDSVGAAMEQLPTKVRPKQKYKTDRKDLDGRSGEWSGKGIDPMTDVKKAPDIAMKTTQTLIPSQKPVYDRYKSGDIFKSAFGSKQGITSEKFWRRPPAEEEKAKGIIRKDSNPELFFAFNKDGKRFRKYKSGGRSYFPYILLNDIETMSSQFAKRSARVLPADLCTDYVHYVKIQRSTVMRRNKNMAVEGGTVFPYYILVIFQFS